MPARPDDTPITPPRIDSGVTTAQHAGPSASARTTMPQSVALPPGDSAGPGAVPGFEIVSVLGRGGMGVVYKARQTALRRDVALKMVLAGGQATDEERDRFRGEALAAARLQHPNIVRVYEVGEHDGLPYLALEFCDGGTLARRLAGQPLPPADAAAVVETLARAMHYAHTHGVVHRDLKPANVLLSPAEEVSGEGGSLAAGLAGGALGGWDLKVADFGLAKRLDASHGQTATGAVLGTPSYMAPEQADGRGKQAGPAADVYALGAILYECLTGRPPFQAATSFETILQVLQNEPAPPSRVRPGVPRALETVCLKCLEKAPGKRYPSALALAEDLRQFRAGRRVVARPPGVVERSIKWARRHPTGAAVLGLLAVGALAGAVGLYAFVTRLRFERDRAEAEKRDAQRVLYTAQMNLVQSAWQENRAGAALALLEEQRPKEGTDDLRGFEWYYWWGQCHTALRTFAGHKGTVHGAVFAPDGARLATADDGGVVRLWDPRTGAELFRRQCAEPIYGLAYSPDGRRVACTDNEKVVRVWDAADGRELIRFTAEDLVLCLAYSPDGKRLAGGLRGGAVAAWDATTGQRLFEVDGHDDDAWGIAVSPDGSSIATAGSDATLRVWDAGTGAERLKLVGHTDKVYWVAFSKDGRRLASAGHDHTARVWDAATGKEQLRLDHADTVHCVAFNPGVPGEAGSATRLATAAETGVVTVWDAATGRSLFTLKGHAGGVERVAYSPDGTRLITGGADGTVRLWDAAGNVEARTVTAPTTGSDTSVDGLAFSPDGGRLVYGSSDGAVRVVDARTWRLARQWPARHDDMVRDLAIAADGRLCTAGGHAVRVWDPQGKELLSVGGHDDLVVCVAVSSDGGRIASAGGKSVRVRDAATGNILRTLEHPAGVRQVAFSPDGSRLATAADDGPRVWDLATGRELFAVTTADAICAVAFSPDGARLAADDGSTVRVWDVATARELFTLRGHGDSVHAVAFSPDGRRLASGAADRTVRLWDLATGRQVLRLDHDGPVLRVAFSPDGTRLAASGIGRTIRVWDAVP